MKQDKSHYPQGGMNKALATSAARQQRSPANFSQQGRPLSGPYSAQAAQAKQMNQMQKGTKKAINQVIKQGDLDITGAQKAKIFDQIDPKNNGPQRSKKLGY